MGACNHNLSDNWCMWRWWIRIKEMRANKPCNRKTLFAMALDQIWFSYTPDKKKKNLQKRQMQSFHARLNFFFRLFFLYYLKLIRIDWRELQCIQFHFTVIYLISSHANPKPKCLDQIRWNWQDNGERCYLYIHKLSLVMI